MKHSEDDIILIIPDNEFSLYPDNQEPEEIYVKILRTRITDPIQLLDSYRIINGRAFILKEIDIDS